MISAAGKKHDRKNNEKDQDNGDQVTALIFPTIIGIKKKSSGYDNQCEVDQHISPGAGPATEKSHDQTDNGATGGEDVEQPDTEIQGGAE